MKLIFLLVYKLNTYIIYFLVNLPPFPVCDVNMTQEKKIHQVIGANAE